MNANGCWSQVCSRPRWFTPNHPVRRPMCWSYAFNDEMVQGDLYDPDSEVLQVRRRAHKTSLVEVRAGYLRELIKSVEDL